MTTRRGFLGAILAAGLAPAIVKAGVLMPVRAIALPQPTLIWRPQPYISKLVQPAIAYDQEVLKVGESFIRTTGDLALGDMFTIAGMKRKFVVTGVVGGVITIA